MNLQNKIAIITGGTDGLGLSIANELLAKGCVVHVIAKGLEKSNQLDKRIIFYQGDVTDTEKLESIAKEINDCDILINNAGIWLEGSINDNSFEDISRVIDVNLKGVINTTKVFLPYMLKKDDGFILNISSTSGLKGRDNQSVYVASKFSVHGFSEALKEDLKQTNIKVSGFYQGGMNTKLFEKSGFPKQNSDWMDTNKVAKIISFILELDDSMILDHVVLNKRNTKASN